MCGKATCCAPSPTFQLDRLRFVTDSDYPPFHYFDEEGVLTGFNVDLARAICEALGVECEIRPVDWEDLFKNLDDGEADAAIASIRIDADSLTKADFSSRYYATPGRFIARKDERAQGRSPRNGGRQEDRRGARAPAMRPFSSNISPPPKPWCSKPRTKRRRRLKAGDIDFVFGDGVGLTFWLNGVTSDACCEFRGGSYFDAKFFGEGVGIAVKKGNRQLVEVLNYALEQVHASGRYEGLFLRYFPMSFF